MTVTNNPTLNLPTNVNLNSDNNGSLTNDGTRTFAYDSENQLTNVSAASQWKTEFVYDGLGRRRVVKDYSWQGGQWVKTNEVHYIYDGMLIIQERDSNNVPVVTYTRGLDLGNELQRAGGIGGLLARTDANGSTFYHSIRTATNGMTICHPFESQYRMSFTLLTCPVTMERSFHLSFRTPQHKGHPHPVLSRSTP
jgi:YD repeat-containing protein